MQKDTPERAHLVLSRQVLQVRRLPLAFIVGTLKHRSVLVMKQFSMLLPV